MAERTVLITGAASGIGLACARLALETGANVVAFDVESERMATALSDDDARLATYVGDVAQAEHLAGLQVGDIQYRIGRQRPATGDGNVA